ncbi:MAG: phosphate signaling complex protein PhoU [Thermosulfidibacteraceae bacterium]|jgi:phosphate transport system protein
MVEEALKKIKDLLKQASELASNMVKLSTEGLVKRKKELLEKVLYDMEPKLDAMSIEIDEACISFLAKYQPLAKDLRTVATCFKIIDDVERIGDLAVNVAESAIFLIGKPQVKPLIDIPRMASEVSMMLAQSIEAFLNENIELAKEVWLHDDVIDTLRDQVNRELLTYMISDPTTIERCFHLMRIARCLERIGDHTTNIAERTIYMISGEIIAHQKRMKNIEGTT